MLKLPPSVVGLLVFSFLLDYLQIYFMQWAGQMVMFDLRSRFSATCSTCTSASTTRTRSAAWSRASTSDVDALNEMFTSGVVSIFEDVFVLAGIVWLMLRMNWNLALITLAVLPLIAFATKIFRDKVRDSYRRIRTAIARINAYMQEHVSGMVVLQLFNREKRAFDKFSEVNAVHMEAFKDAIMAHAVYYPVVEILSSTAIACVIWFGGNDIIRNYVSSVAVDFSSQNLLFIPVVHRGEHRSSHGFHPVCAALLPAHSGFQREVQHSAVGDGGQRTSFQIAGYSG